MVLCIKFIKISEKYFILIP